MMVEVLHLHSLGLCYNSGHDDKIVLSQQRRLIMSKIRQRYDDEFCKNAVKLSYATTKPIKEFCADLGIRHSLIYRWRKIYTESGEKTKVAEQQDQFRRLQLELAELKMENEMLKKAAAYFAKNLK
jgi:transposase